MSEMAGKVAQAIFDKIRPALDKSNFDALAMMNIDSLDIARAAIAAMREPTEAMCDAAHSAELAATDQPALSLHDLRRKAARKFTAMIDEALK